MKKHKAIPQGYMTVGELAKKMGTTVRTLQYYDKEGILSPSAESEGGRRLYSDKDIILLYQIQSLKYLGFSLDDIKNRLTSFETPKEVAIALEDHAALTRKKIADLTESLYTIEALEQEVLQMQTVDFKKYADIIVNLRIKNGAYSVIKYMDSDMLDQVRSRFDEESGAALNNKLNRLNDEAIRFQEEGVLPESPQGQTFAEEFWNTVTEFTGGDMTLFSKMLELSKTIDGKNDEWVIKNRKANVFIEPALIAYFTKLGINPFEGADI